MATLAVCRNEKPLFRSRGSSQLVVRACPPGIRYHISRVAWCEIIGKCGNNIVVCCHSRVCMEDDDSEYVPESSARKILNGPKIPNQRKEEEVTHGVVQYYIYK